MESLVDWPRRQVTRTVALALAATMFLLGQPPSVSADEVTRMARRYAFEPLSIALPTGLPVQSTRSINQDYGRVAAWVSSVGASIAMNDLTGDGLDNDLCLTDPRIDEAVVTPAPGGRTERYQPFVLNPSPLPVDSTMAPMGCVPGDFNADGWMDLLVYYWGRTPILFLVREQVSEFGADRFQPIEMINGVSSEGSYEGPQWNTNAVTVADFDGDGYEDIFIGNFWPHGPVLNPAASGGVEMPASLSSALNGGESYVYRWTGGAGGPSPSVRYGLARAALPGDVPYGWVLAAAATDLDGDLLPELYLAHDFGPDRMLHNRSTPGDIRFTSVYGERRPLVPKSKVVGMDSFKGMGVDFADLTGDGMYDLFVSNITTSYGIQESNFAWVSTARDQAEARASLFNGVAPFADHSTQLGLAWSGWGWDVKLADLNNSGALEVVQTTGFIKGKVNRWPQLQELATANDDLISDPQLWPHIRPGDDVSGDQTLAFFSRSDSGRYVDLSEPLGLAAPVPTRGVAVGDADGDGRLDLAIARQWEEPIFYRNLSPTPGQFLGLRLAHATGPNAAEPMSAPGSPVVDAQVTVITVDGRRFIGHSDGGSGHAGKRSHAVMVGIGEVAGPLTVEIAWRDRNGERHQQVLQLDPGWHRLHLGERAREVRS